MLDGIGIGLNNCYVLTKILNGKIKLFKNEFGGTTVEFTVDAQTESE